ncbi:sentrin-specific cysteine protease [Pseudovirgaria hyperparasitica]|uniref:Sentrin-specific cysteine protease n=1 Tax=Pseudovirgaria hyperparasitica TaxID=470096 RepID=A0A6A6W2S6_9PEZI|nr:sentrin-specific cysteine protease [Pseudovirgaria hyperparasitica]KAF2757238.1 sentrin-specific cysteine protease [Pseudovirgaria hyperparasitica]
MSFHPFGGRVSNRLRDTLSDKELSEAYLIYNDVKLTRRDYNSIKDDWLTDEVISFWEEYLEREELSKYPQATISLLRPSMAQLLRKTPDPLTLKSNLPDFTRTTHVFLPVNNSEDVTEAESGSHWSLLLVSTIDQVAFHYDSLGTENIVQAGKVTQNLGRLINKHIKFINMEDAPIQNNGSDCGVFVCLIMKHLLLNRLLTVPSKKKISMSMVGRDIDADKGRHEMRRLINKYRDQASKS